MARQQALSTVARDSARENIQNRRRKNEKPSRYPWIPPLHPSREVALEKYQSTPAQMSPLMCQSQQTTVTTDHAQGKVDDWLYKNKIRVMKKLPKLDPLTLANRGSNVSKYMNFIHPSPLSFKLPPDGDTRQVKTRGNPDATKKQTRKSKEYCPRLMRTLRTEKELFALNPVVRVGGGYRRITWQVVNALPGIDESSLDNTSSLRCVNCGVHLTTTEEIREERGRLRTIPSILSDCQNCGTDNSLVMRSSQETLDEVGHESVGETLAKGDARFIVDHRRGRRQHETGTKVQSSNSKAQRPYRRRRNFDEEMEPNDMTADLESAVDWRDDIDSFRIHQSRNEGEDDVIPLEDKSNCSNQDQHSVLFLTELGTSVEQIKDPPDVRRAWDDGVTANAVITREYDKDTNNWKENYDVTAEDDYPEFGISVKIGRANRPGLKGHVASAPVSNRAANRRPGKDNYKGNGGDLNARSHSTPGVRQRSDITVNRGLEDGHAPSFLGGDESVEGYPDEERFLRPETHVHSGRTKRGSDEVEWAQRHEQEGKYERECPVEPVREGYLADSEDDFDLLTLQAQLQGLRLKSQTHAIPRDTKGVASQGNKETDRVQMHGKAETSEKEVKRKSAQATSRDAPGLDSDSDWDSDGSLHVTPLSDISVSSGEGDIESWGADIDSYRRAAIEHEAESTSSVEKGRKDKLSTKESPVGTTMVSTTTREETSQAAAPQRVRASHKRGLQSRNSPVSKGIPQHSEEIDRKELRSFRDDDELSESDLKYFIAQLESASFSKAGKEANTKGVRCPGINCHRCNSVIPQCEGTCAVCGTFCQRAGGACKACRGICENCSKPLDRCESREEALDPNEDEEGSHELIIPDIHLHKPVPTEESGSQCSETDSNGDSSRVMEDTPQAKSSKPERVKRKSDGVDLSTKSTVNDLPPPVLKTKDASVVKRVSKMKAEGLVRRNSSELVRPEEQDSFEIDEDSMTEEPFESAPKPDSPDFRPSPPRTSKTVKKSKPSRRIISQTVVYKTKPRDKSEQASEQPSLPDVQESGEEWEEEGTGEEETGSLEKDWTPVVEEQETPVVTAMQAEESNTKQTVEESDLKKTETRHVEENCSPKEDVEMKPLLIKVRGVARVNAAFKERADLGKRLHTVMRQAISDVIGEADRQTRRDSTIDYLSQYRLVDRARLEVYGRAFTLEDEDEDGIISYQQMLLALEGIPTITGMSRKQLMYVLQVLDLGPLSRITFKMFAVIIALCERVITLDPLVKDLVEKLDLAAIESKLDVFKNIFYVTGDRSVSFIRQRDLRIELKAGGLSQKQEDHVISHIQSTNRGEISFLDYMAYIPLFLSIHQNICDNALDMSRDKYKVRK